MTLACLGFDKEQLCIGRNNWPLLRMGYRSPADLTHDLLAK